MSKAGWEVEGFIARLTARDDKNSERLVLEAISHLRAFSRDCDALRDDNRNISAENEWLRAPPTKAEVEATARIITNLRAVDHSKEVLPFKYYRDVARVVLGAAAKVREGK